MNLNSYKATTPSYSSPCSKLPTILWFQIFKCCDIKTFLSLRLVARKLKENTDNYTDIYETECLRLFTSDLAMYRYVAHLNVAKALGIRESSLATFSLQFLIKVLVSSFSRALKSRRLQFLR